MDTNMSNGAHDQEPADGAPAPLQTLEFMRSEGFVILDEFIKETKMEEPDTVILRATYAAHGQLFERMVSPLALRTRFTQFFLSNRGNRDAITFESQIEEIQNLMRKQLRFYNAATEEIGKRGTDESLEHGVRNVLLSHAKFRADGGEKLTHFAECPYCGGVRSLVARYAIEMEKVVKEIISEMTLEQAVSMGLVEICE